jgi:hypothetical protein
MLKTISRLLRYRNKYFSSSYTFVDGKDTAVDATHPGKVYPHQMNINAAALILYLS